MLMASISKSKHALVVVVLVVVLVVHAAVVVVVILAHAQSRISEAISGAGRD